MISFRKSGRDGEPHSQLNRLIAHGEPIEVDQSDSCNTCFPQKINILRTDDKPVKALCPVVDW